MPPTEETLDPADWDAFRAVAHRAVDDAIAHTRGLRDRPVWRPMPAEARAFFTAPVPRAPTGLATVCADVRDRVMAYPMGNTHPRFWSWYMGSSNLTGALGDFLAAVDGSNLGGGDHAARAVDDQVVNWLKEMMGFPATASGTLVSGGSVANLIGLTVARNAAAKRLGVDIRENGLAALPRPLRFYGSDQIHSCHQKAVEALGLGNAALCRIPSRPDLTMDVEALATAIAADRARGLEPACIIATAATVNTGSVDPLDRIADLAAAGGLWLHVDGCIGALLAIAPRHRHLVAGIARADSIALDPHKWLHAPFELGCALVRDAAAHLATFSLSPEYLHAATRGISAGPNWLFDFGLQTSRGFRALKLWMSLREQGLDKFGRLIDQNIDQAKALERILRARPHIEIVAPTVVNIVCFRYDPGGLDAEALKALNTEIMLRLQEQGIAAVFDTTVQGWHCLRAAIVNHRTRSEDLTILADAVERMGRELAPAAAPAAR